MSMRLVSTTRLVGLLLSIGSGASVATAQPTLTVSADVVTPGTPVTATVTGAPGKYVAVIGSMVGAGFSYGGVPLAVGADVVILAQGTLDALGTFEVAVTQENAELRAEPARLRDMVERIGRR